MATARLFASLLQLPHSAAPLVEPATTPMANETLNAARNWLQKAGGYQRAIFCILISNFLCGQVTCSGSNRWQTPVHQAGCPDHQWAWAKSLWFQWRRAAAPGTQQYLLQLRTYCLTQHYRKPRTKVPSRQQLNSAQSRLTMRRGTWSVSIVRNQLCNSSPGDGTQNSQKDTALAETKGLVQATHCCKAWAKR